MIYTDFYFWTLFVSLVHLRQKPHQNPHKATLEKSKKISKMLNKPLLSHGTLNHLHNIEIQVVTIWKRFFKMSKFNKYL